MFHEFVSVDNYVEVEDILDVLEYIKKKIYNISSSIKIDDDIVQIIMLEKRVNTPHGVEFNYWGITIINGEAIEKWIDIINGSYSQFTGKTRKQIKALKRVFVDAKNTNKTIIHLGI